jgi:type IX secretion system PorP/SprF family membrane protein
MCKSISRLFLALLFVPALCYGQDTDISPGYQEILINNPAMSGSSGESELRMSYLNHYPGNSYNLHSVYVTYDSYFQGIHGGVAVYLTDDYLGSIVNDIRGGFSYAYFLQAGKDLYINAGLTAALFHRGYNFENALFPDQIDPLGGIASVSAENPVNTGRTVLDVGAGFLFTYRRFSGGFSIDHLARPDISGNGSDADKLRRKVLVHLAEDIGLKSSGEMKLFPLAIISIQGNSVAGGVGASFETKHLAINTILFGDNGQNTNIQAGFSFKAGAVSIYYNYRFNITAGNELMPLSLLHQTGMAFSFNKVEKRNTIKTINFPKL